jgi:hypothetical protein
MTVLVPVMGMVVVIVVVPVVIMAMIMVVVMVMIVAVVVAMMIVAMIMMAVRMFRGGGIGAAFGIEWRFDFDDFGAEALHHVLDHVIAADAQPLGHDLRRQMAIAEMPGDTHEMTGIGAANLDQRFGGCDHLDHAAVFQHQTVAAAQCDSLGKVEQEFQATGARHRHASAMAPVEIEDDGIGGLFRPARLAEHLGGADHGLTFIKPVSCRVRQAAPE